MRTLITASLLADRLLDETKAVNDRENKAKSLMIWIWNANEELQLKAMPFAWNMPIPMGKPTDLTSIDTPGHVDFSYEVSRSIASCEGALLLVDATQGIQAQTISNLYLALENDLEIIPVINKIDMDGAMIEEVSDQIIDLIGCEAEDIVHASGKTGVGVPDILSAVVDRIPAPKGDPNAPCKR